MSKALGKQMVIENVGGAGGTIGSARVAAAAPDGYTLLAGSMGSHVSAPVLTPGIKYNSERDFAPVGFTAHAPAVVVARKDFPAKDLRGVRARYLKTKSSKIKQAHGGIGASSHMACLLFNSIASVNPISVAYRGTAPAMNDLIAGHVDYLCEQAVSVAGAINGGQVKALAVSSNERLPTLPAVPTAKEAGVDYQMSIWAGIFAPKGTPKPVVDRLADRARQGARRSGGPAADDRSRRLDPIRRRAHAGQVRKLRHGADRALVADPQGGNQTGELIVAGAAGGPIA